MQKCYQLKNPHDEFEQQWNAATVASKTEDVYYSPEILEALFKYVKKTDKLIEAGCGLGGWVNVLHENGYDALGVDFVESAVKAMKEYKPELKAEMGDCTNLKYKDSSFDAYLSLGVIEHLEEGPDAFLKEASRILKKGGVGIISVPNQACLQYKRKKNPKKYRGKQLVFFQYEFLRDEFEDALKKSGFEVIDFFYNDFHSYIWNKHKWMRSETKYKLNKWGEWLRQRYIKKNDITKAMMQVAVVRNIKEV